jgi:fumarylacetoacetase
MDESLRAEWNRQSWIESANDGACGFPLQGLPYCVFASGDGPHMSVGIGSFVLDLHQCSIAGVLRLPDAVLEACKAPMLNALIACGRSAHEKLREQLMQLLDISASESAREAVTKALVPMQGARFLKPLEPPNYTDFYASIHHATRVGRLFRPEQPLLPNYKFVPIGYHGRASSIIVSGTPVRRPCGQTKPADGGVPAFGPSRFLDYEVEVAIYVTGSNTLGESVPIDRAEERVFGISLLNDWSARDIQAWEYQPLGPFLAKSFATTVSPWVVPIAALVPFRCAATRPEGDPAPLKYLFSAEDQQSGAIDLKLEAYLLTSRMRESSLEPHRLSRANLRDLYWTPSQLIAHHTSNGCNLLPGDLLATGTVSGPEDDSAGCLLELTESRRKPLVLPNGETRTALEDDDEVILRGVCRREGFPEISLGECRGMVLPSR